MATTFNTNSAQKSNKTPKAFEPQELSEESINLITEALRSTKNIDQLIAKINSASKGRKFKAEDNNSVFASPQERKTLSASKSLAGPVAYFQPMEHLDSSDEDECTFHPKINNNANRLSQQRIITHKDHNEFLFRSATEKVLKRQEAEDMNNFHRDKQATVSKMDPKSVQIVFKRLQQAIKNLINENESSENKGKITFEGLGRILHKLGVFQNLEFIPQENDPERSTVSVNRERVKPERLNSEILFHENLWKICSLPSSNPDFITSELLFKVLIVLLEEKAQVAESSAFLMESILMALEEADLGSKDDSNLFAQLKEEKGLWSLEKVVSEFRKLFDNKTFFMPIYNYSDLAAAKNEILTKQYANSHAPEINKNSKKLDSRYFTPNFVKKVASAHSSINESHLQDRKLRLHNYHKYLTEKKNRTLEAKIQEELLPCTFTPNIKKYTKSNAPQKENASPSQSPNKSMGNSSPKKGYFSKALEDNTAGERHQLLYEVAHHYKEKLHQKTYAMKKKEEIQELSHCTFAPRLNGDYYSNPETREEDFYSKVPNGFKKSVERVYKGVQQTYVKKAALEKVPRGENYEKNRFAPFIPPVQLSRPKIQRKEVLVYVDVSIGHGRTGRIGIHKGDNAKSLAHYFARTYSLNSNMQESLEKLLQSYINSYFAQSPTNEQVDQPAQEDEHIEEGQEHDEEEDDDEEEEEEDGYEYEEHEEVEEVEEEEEEDEERGHHY